MRHLRIILTCALMMPLSGIAHADSGLSQNQASFKWLRPVQGQILKPYSEGMAAYCVAGKWGYLDKNGNISIISKYEEAGDFEDGLAVVKLDGK